MHQRIVRRILLVLCLLLSYNEVQGEKKLTMLEDMELEKQLKFLNKSTIKTVKVIIFYSQILSFTIYLLFLFDIYNLYLG